MLFRSRPHTDPAGGRDRDAEVPITQSYEYWNALRRLGVKSEFVVYPDEGHFFFKRSDQADVMERVVAWFNIYLKPGEPRANSGTRSARRVAPINP